MLGWQEGYPATRIRQGSLLQVEENDLMGKWLTQVRPGKWLLNGNSNSSILYTKTQVK